MAANNLMDRVLRKLGRPAAPSPAAGPRALATSLSDNQAYPQACLDAANAYSAFNQFRRNPVYNEILEHVSESQGRDYLALLSRDPEVLAALSEFRRNDDHGNPRVFEYPGIGSISPTTLRYIKVLADLKGLFGTLDALSLAEIGVGYGGQCRIINAFFRPAAYRLIDIQPALALAGRYLDHFILPSVLTYSTMNATPPADHDLVMSNYAFTELPRAIQDVYLAKVILRARRGYITYNEITPESFRSYKSGELLEMIPGARLVKEEPLTWPGNCIIVWGA